MFKFYGKTDCEIPILGELSLCLLLAKLSDASRETWIGVQERLQKVIREKRENHFNNIHQ